MNSITTRTLVQITLIGIVLCTSLLLAETALGKIGVGMGAGEVRVTEDIKPGGMYVLPNLRVFNTGDETTTYGMNVAYHQDNPQIRPAKSWFSFEPSTFRIEPGESQEISISMTVPVKALPGEYFAFLESGPVSTQEQGTSVGVAVATKLYFNVVPANVWQAFVYRATAFMHTYAPWTWIGLGIIVFVGSASFFRRFFSLSISRRPKQEGE